MENELKMKRSLLFFPILILACTSNGKKQSDYVKDTSKEIGIKFITEKTKDGVLIERIYYNRDTIPLSMVIFDLNVPNDSLFIEFSKLDSSWKVRSFHKENERYLENDVPINNSYASKLSQFEDCSYWKYSESKILKDEFNNICLIGSSSLTSGKNAEELKYVKNDGETTQVTYDGLNSKFPNLSEDITSYFYMKELVKFEVEFFKRKLKVERYYFENGLFIKEYSYSNDGSIDVKCLINYTNFPKKASSFKLRYLTKKYFN